MNKIMTNKVSKLPIASAFNDLALDSNSILICSAFFSENKVLADLVSSEKDVTIIVSLRPPTNYYSLKSIMHNKNVNIFFLGDDFHSKIYGFYDLEGSIESAIIGSSNFTNGGLVNNYETNLVTKDENILSQIDLNLAELLKSARKLDSSILESYKERYEKFLRFKNSDDEFDDFKIYGGSYKVSGEASKYLDFWNVVDHIKTLVSDISSSQYPKVPPYLVLDHFWHWVVKKCDDSKLANLDAKSSSNKKVIRKLFREYCSWDKSKSENHSKKIKNKSTKMQSILSKEKISSLSKADALYIFECLHASSSIIKRFGADKKFIKENKISNIRKSFVYLLNEDLPVDVRINSLVKNNSNLKLKQFGSSCVQELIGWVAPDVMPIRNKKADKALILLGY